MGVDVVLQLIVGVAGEAQRPGGTLMGMARSGQWGPFDGNEDPWSWPGKGAPEGLQWITAGDSYDGTGRVLLGVPIGEVSRRETPRNLGGGWTEEEFFAKVHEAKRVMDRHGIHGAQIWMVPYVG